MFVSVGLPMMIAKQNKNRAERGSTLIEFTVVSGVFFMMLIGIVAGSNLYFAHNALVEATRRAARFAATQSANATPGTVTSGTNVGPSVTAIRNYAIYGNSAGTGPKIVSNLQPANISVEYSSFGVGAGTVSVSITGYNYNFVIPGINRQIAMPACRSTATGESAGTSPP